MKWKNKGREFEKYKEVFTEKKKIYIYGAGENGRDLFDKLSFADCVEAFIDNDVKKIKKEMLGKEVISSLAFINNKIEDAIVVVAMSRENTPIIMNQMILAGLQEGKNLFDYEIFVRFYISLFAFYAWKKVYIPTISFLMTTICNLDCKGCLNFTHQNKYRRHYELERLKNDIDILFSKVDYVGLLHLCGGEPFLFPHFPELIDYINDNYKDKVGKLGTTTNGTVRPSKELLEKIKSAEVMVWLDDYRENVKLAQRNFNEVEALLQTNKIEYVINIVDSWINILSDESLSEEKQLVERCTMCAVPFVSLKEGRLYACNYGNYAAEAGLSEEFEEDYLDLTKDIENRIEIIEFNYGYSEKGYFSFCHKCNGYVSINSERIPVAEQY